MDADEPGFFLYLCLSAFICGSISAQPSHAILWTDPGPVDKLDLAGGAGAPVSAPKPPFVFLREDLSGTQPKLFVRDANATTWNVKFGFEVKPESFCWRILAAVGYFAEPSFYIASGRIEQLRPMRRSTSSMTAAGDFRQARFQYRDPDLAFQKGRNWRWDRNPFTGTKELNGLKVLLMLLSNYDNKDGAAPDPNTAIFMTRRPPRRMIYAFTDWGSAMGRWGDRIGQSNWDCAGFTEQTPLFVSAVDGDRILFGYEGHMPNFTDNIRVEHVRWLLERLGAISDDQIKGALRASGATPAEELCFSKALRTRIHALENATTPSDHGLANNAARSRQLRRRGRPRADIRNSDRSSASPNWWMHAS